MVTVRTALTFIFTLFVKIQCQRFPVIHPLDDEHVVPVGSRWSILCSGDQPVDWILPSGEVADTIQEKNKGDVLRPFFSLLALENLTFSDTGKYTCQYKDSKNSDSDAETYLFATDPNRLFVANTSVATASIREYEETVIHLCRTTHPNITMKIFKDKKEITDLASFFLKYDPKEGLIVTDGKMDLHFGQFVCQASYSGSHDSVTIILNVEPSPGDLPTPSISSSNEHGYVTVGDNVSLTCSVQLEPGERNMDLTWEFPNPAEALKAKSERRIIIEPTKIENYLTDDYQYNNGEPYKKLVRTFHLNPLEPSDIGSYSCKYTHDNVQSDPATYSLTKVLLDRNEPFIEEPEFNGHHVLALDASNTPESVQWVFKMFVHPNTSDYTWYNTKGDYINFKELEKYHYDVDPKTGYIKVIINNVNLNDTGSYKFVVEAKTNKGILSKDVYLYLKYFSPPEVKLITTNKTSSGFFIFEQSYSLVCKIEGYPIDESSIGWSFRPCKNYDDCGSERNITKELVRRTDNITDDDYHYRFTSGKQIEARDSGIYSCYACRAYSSDRPEAHLDCSRSSMNVFVSEFENGHSISSVTTKNIVAGDNVSIVCGASKYNFSSISWFKEENRQRKLISSPQAKSADTRLSHISILEFSNVSFAQRGAYVCVAIPRISSQDLKTSEQEYGLVVINPEKPTPSKSNNLNGQTLNVNSSTEVIIDCSANGIPSPEILWFKDGQNYSKDSRLDVGQSFEHNRIRFSVPLSHHSGSYECEARNRAGSFRRQITLVVEEPDSSRKGLLAGTGVAIAVIAILCVVLLWQILKRKDEIPEKEIENFYKGDPSAINPEMTYDEQLDLLPYNKDFEFPLKSLTLGKVIGKGAFGQVRIGKAKNILPWEEETIVAVKRLHNALGGDQTHDYFKSFIAELKIMIHLGNHINILNVLGANTKNFRKRDILVITEYCRYGNILKYLLAHRKYFINQVDNDGKINFDIDIRVSQNHRSSSRKSARESSFPTIRYISQPSVTKRDSTSSENPEESQVMITGMTTIQTDECDDGQTTADNGAAWMGNIQADYDAKSVKPLLTKDLIFWAYQIASGMEYVTRKKVMHGDLACRNVLLSENNIIKVSDFGLSKDLYKSNVYKKQSSTLLPFKWLAFESIRDGIFSTESDVWSFGVVLWEMFSLGRTPYPGIDPGENLFDKISCGYRMAKPDFSTLEIYQIMLDCWNEQPQQRPSFSNLKEIFFHLMEMSDRQLYAEQIQMFQRKTELFKRKNSSELLGTMADPSHQSRVCMGTNNSCVEYENFKPTLFSNSDYLVPDRMQGSNTNGAQTLAVDNQGYLLATAMGQKNT